MIELFDSLEPLQKFFWIVACAASLVFIIQTVMTFVGLGTDADIDAGPLDSSVDSFEDGTVSGVFSFRNLINFLLGYGWAGVLFFDSIEKSFGIYQRSSGSVYEHNAFFHFIDGSFIDHMVCFIGERAVQGDDVAFLKQCLEICA